MSVSIERQRYDFSLKYLTFAIHVNGTLMKNKTHKIFSIALLAVMLVLGGCAKVSQIRMTSVSLSSITPKGLRSVSLTLSAGVHNPASQVSMSEISGQVLISGKIIGNVAMAPVILEARTDSTYQLQADVALADGVSAFEVLNYVRHKDLLDKTTVNVYAKAKMKGLPAKQIKMEDMPLKQLLEQLKR